MTAFRRDPFTKMPCGPATQFTTRVKAPEEEHTTSIGKVLSWLDAGVTSQREQVKKNRLRERSRS